MRQCVGCEKPTRTPRSKWCADGETCKKRQQRAAAKAAAKPVEVPLVRDVQDALELELRELRVAHTYEGRVALGIAAQLDRGAVQGAAYASLSKELDRRVDALRLKAELPDDPVRSAQDAIDSKRAHLRAV